MLELSDTKKPDWTGGAVQSGLIFLPESFVDFHDIVFGWLSRIGRGAGILKGCLRHIRDGFEVLGSCAFSGLGNA